MKAAGWPRGQEQGREEAVHTHQDRRNMAALGTESDGGGQVPDLHPRVGMGSWWRPFGSRGAMGGSDGGSMEVAMGGLSEL